MVAKQNLSYIVTTLLVFVNLRGGLSLYEGDPCTLKKGTNGVCKYLTDCAAAVASLNQGIYPEDNCGFEGSQVIICCEGAISEVKPTPKPTPAPTPKPTPKPTPPPTKKPTPSPLGADRKPGEISKAKCREFAQYAYETATAPTLSILTQSTTQFECAFDQLPLIVGGTLASRKEFPHMALIGYETGDTVQWLCGGSLVSEDFVLTAGHCLKNRDVGSAKRVRLGITNLTDLYYLQEIRISQIIKYPKYENKKYHDIGLLKLEYGASLNPYVRPACLFTEYAIPREKAIASGWGKVEYAGEGSNDLLKVVLEFFSTQKCNKTYRRDINAPDSDIDKGILDDIMVCAGSSTDLKDTCQGDSGGPLQIYHENTGEIKCMYQIVGVTSFGKSCGLAKNVPGVYTRVSAYVQWLEDTIWPK